MPLKSALLIWKLLKGLVYFLLGIVFLYFLFALVFSYLPAHPPEIKSVKNKTVYITSNGVHLDIILPVNDVDTILSKQLKLSSGVKFVSFGWGDKLFYINTPEWSDLTFRVAFTALFLKSESAMHVTPYNTKFNSWRRVEICQNQLKVVNDYILESFEKNGQGEIVQIEAEGYGYDDYFYEATGNFTLFRTCNVWVNIALKRMGIRTSVWSPFDFGVLYHLP